MSIRGDVLDIPDLQRRGVLKKKEVSQSAAVVKTDKDGFVDFFSRNNPAQVAPESPISNPFSFLDSLPSQPSPNPLDPVPTVDLRDLKVKLEDLEYKLERLMEKVAKLEGS